MNKDFAELLEAYLDSECGDFSMSYTWRWDDDLEMAIATIKSDYNGRSKEVNFRYDEKSRSLTIELSEGSFYETAEYEWSVKYFWMLVAPALWSEN